LAVAKRFTESSKWKKQWFRKLPPKMKAAWQYLCDTCDHAGIWEVDFDALSFNVCGPTDRITPEECEQHFGDRFIRISPEKFFLPGFIVFQYGDTLSIKNNTHLSVLKLLERHEITGLVRGPWFIDRTTDRKNNPLQPEEVNPGKVRSILDAQLGKVTA
jgi:hypothetical protein